MATFKLKGALHPKHDDDGLNFEINIYICILPGVQEPNNPVRLSYVARFREY